MVLNEICKRCGSIITVVGSQLCAVCGERLDEDVETAMIKFVGLPEVEEGMELMLKGLSEHYGLDITSEHFKDTPRRVARSYAEIFEGVKDTDKKVKTILSTAFTSDCDQMILVKGINIFSMCPHHFLPVEYFVSVAYIPKGKVLGISKLPRLVEILAKRPVIQEDLTTQIADALMSIGSAGSAVKIEGKHLCMGMRGIRRPEASAITSAVLGAFRDEPETRAEFFDLVQNTGFSK